MRKLGGLNYISRLKEALPVSLAFCLSFILIGCMAFVAENPGGLPFKLSDIAPTLLLVTAACFALLLFLIPLFRGKIYKALVLIVSSALFAGYIQGSFLNMGLGELTGDMINWDSYIPSIVGSSIFWLAVFAAFFLLAHYKETSWRVLTLFLPVILVAMQTAGLASTLYDYNKAEASSSINDEEMLTIDGLHNPASEKNAIIFVLDRLDEEFVIQIEKNNPGFFDVLDGFTKFDDNISYNGSTFPSVAGMLTGNRYMYDRTRVDYLDYAWANAEMMNEMKARGVDIRLFMERGYAYSSSENLKGIAGNIGRGHFDISERIALIKLLKLSGFRYAPTPLKQAFWISPTEFGDTLTFTDSNAFYFVNDFAFYENIREFGLSPSEAEMGFFYYHLQGAHGPLNMDENIEWVEEEITNDYTAARVRQATGCFKIIFEYLDQLKALGLYEDATIIITGDHPDFRGNELENPALTALFVKPAGSYGTPLAYSHAPVCPDQLPGTVMEGLFGDRGGYAPGYMDVEEGAEAVRVYDINLYSYEILGDGRDIGNWTFSGLHPDTWWKK